MSKGDRWDGDFIDGKIVTGTLRKRDGTLYEGQFSNYEMTGSGTLTTPDKIILKGKFLDGKLTYAAPGQNFLPDAMKKTMPSAANPESIRILSEWKDDGKHTITLHTLHPKKPAYIKNNELHIPLITCFFTDNPAQRYGKDAAASGWWKNCGRLRELQDFRPSKLVIRSLELLPPPTSPPALREFWLDEDKTEIVLDVKDFGEWSTMAFEQRKYRDGSGLLKINLSIIQPWLSIPQQDIQFTASEQ